MSAPTRDGLVRSLAECPPEAVRWAGIGYHLGALDGIQQGVTAEQWGEAARWHKVYLSTRAVLDRPTRAELERRRSMVRTCRCGGCSSCIRRAAVECNRERYGQDDYPGACAEFDLATGVPWPS